MDHVVDIAAATAPSFGLTDELGPLSGEWHTHRRHQLLYASAGTLTLEVGHDAWMLPPQRAAWIRGGTRHRVLVRRNAALRTAYLSPAVADGDGPACQVFSVTPLAREMLLAAPRWGPDSAGDVPERFFAALGALCGQWRQEGMDFRLPRAHSPELARAIRETLRDLSEPSLRAPEVARRAGMSPRTMARRFQAETGMSWRDYVHRARMLEAMALLTDPSVSVTEACYALGFHSLGSFSSSFRAFVGESPSAYRARQG